LSLVILMKVKPISDISKKTAERPYHASRIKAKLDTEQPVNFSDEIFHLIVKIIFG